MQLDNFLNIPSIIVIHDGSGTTCFEVDDNFGDQATSWLGWFEHGDSTVILFNDDLDALLDLGQYRVKIARAFGFAHEDGGHRYYYDASGAC